MNQAKLARQLQDAAGHHQSGDLVNAERLYRLVLKQAPQQPDALHLLGVLLDQRGDTAKGISLVRRALGVQSAFPDAHFNLARMLAAAGDVDGARRHYELTLALKPGHARAHNGLGVLYRAQHDYSQAYAAFERAARFEPRLLEAYINLCNTFRDSCNEAFIPKAANQGLAIDPECTELHLLRAEAYFTAGNLVEGWRDYDWRFSVRRTLLDVKPVKVPNCALPHWKGEDLATKGILIWGEQGVGDEIIFANMLSAISARAGRCVVQTISRLVPLFRRSFPGIEVYADAIPTDVAAALDVQSSLGSIGQWVRSSFRSFPAIGSYLKADVARTAALRAKYAGTARGLIVGLAWRSANVADAAEKTAALEHWGPILKIPGLTFVNLQYGETAEVIAGARAAFGAEVIVDKDVDALADLDGFAAQVAAMDVVISTSNTAAHMAGALGVPTYCMVPRALGGGRRWYWFGEGQYSPWYRALRLFRQTQDHSWTDTIAAVALALMECAIAHAPPSSDYQNMYGMMLARAQRFEDAVQAYRRGIALAPERAEIHNNLGTALRRSGRDSEAEEAYAQAYALNPEHPSIHLNYAMSLADIGRLDAALQSLDRLIEHRTGNVDAQYNRALLLMGLGRLAEGWAAFAWRMKRPFVHVRHTDFPQPLWSGQSLAGRHILAWTDHGLGDEILLGSLIPDALGVARQVTLLCSERLVGLFRRSFPAATVDIRAAPLPAAALSKDIDFQMSIAELGAAFRPNFASFPATSSYLKVNDALRASLRDRYLEHAPRNKLVGISWRSINPEIGAQKGVDLAAWLPILKVRGVTFINLQYGDCSAEIRRLRQDHDVEIIDDTAVDRLGDMDPVAAQVAAMDHVITISNTAAHLAGATGTPAWILVPEGHARLWYWFKGLRRCAWYPSAELRVVEGGDWQKAIARLGADLADRVPS